MPQIVLYDPNATPARVLQDVIDVGDIVPWAGRDDVVIGPDLSHLRGVPWYYWKFAYSPDYDFIEMTPAEKATIDAERAVAKDTEFRHQVKVLIDGQRHLALLLRAFADVLKDEINILRSQHGLSDRTLAQLKSAIASRIDSKTVDE